MRFIPTIIHGILDYLYVLVLLLLPYAYHFNANDVRSYIIDTSASVILVYSLFTKYELGAFKNIPMQTHLIFDLVMGILLAVLPWLFSFSNDVYAPFIFMGIFSICASLLSKSSSDKIGKQHLCR